MEIWGGIGRGTGDSSAACSGMCRTLRGLEDPNVPLSAPTGVQSSLLHLRSSWRNCLDIRNGADSGLRKQSRGVEGVPIGRLLRPKKCARDAFSSFPNGFSTKVGASRGGRP
jgi:hypothetical protein